MKIINFAYRRYLPSGNLSVGCTSSLCRPRHKSFWESRALFSKRALEKTSAFLFAKLFLCASCCQRKSVKRFKCTKCSLYKPFSAFLLAEGGAKEKLTKENAEERFRHCGGEEGSASPHRKLLKKLDQNFLCLGLYKPFAKSKFNIHHIYLLLALFAL